MTETDIHAGLVARVADLEARLAALRVAATQARLLVGADYPEVNRALRQAVDLSRDPYSYRRRTP